MRFIKLSLLAVTLTLLATALKAKAEEGAKANAAPESEIEFNKKSARLTSLATRISEDDKHFQEMVQKKAEETDPKELQFTLKDMADIAKDRNKAVDEYNKLKIELTYKFPNKGMPLNRIYRTQSKRTVEEMEGAAGLDALLTRVHKLIQEKYAPFMPSDKTSAAPTSDMQSRDQKKPDQHLRLER